MAAPLVGCSEWHLSSRVCRSFAAGCSDGGKLSAANSVCGGAGHLEATLLKVDSRGLWPGDPLVAESRGGELTPSEIGAGESRRGEPWSCERDLGDFADFYDALGFLCSCSQTDGGDEGDSECVYFKFHESS